MHNLVCEQVTVYTEVPVAESAFIPATGRWHSTVCCLTLPLIPRRDLGERLAACEAGGAAAGILPRDFDPIYQGEEVVVRTGEMGGENKGEATCGTLRGERAYFRAASGAEVAVSGWPCVASAKGRVWLDRP
jgi:hypothetical protein